jgi:hypothetical protein
VAPRGKPARVSAAAVLPGQRLEHEGRRALQGLLDADALLGHGLEERHSAGIEPLVQDLDRQRVGQVALVVLQHHRDLVGVDLVDLEVLLQVRQAVEVGVDHRLLAVGDEHDAVRPLQDHPAGGVVEDLPGNRVELDARLHAPDGAELDGQEVEEEGPVGLGGQGEHLSLVADRQLLVDPLQVRRLAAQPRPVIDDLRRELFRRIVEQDHGFGGVGILSAIPGRSNPRALC